MKIAEKMAIAAVVTSAVFVFGAPCARGADVRVYVRPLTTAASIDARITQSSVDASAVALGRSYMLSRLARPGRSFVCTDFETNATHVLETTVSGLLSRERDFMGQTYGHSTKTTVWSLDVIVSLVNRKNGEINPSKAVTSTYEERRPISEAQFDNNIFQNLMKAAIEMAAEEVIDFFEGGNDGAAANVAPLPSGAGAVAAAAGARAPVPDDPRPPLAVLKPEALAGVSDQEAMLLWDNLESSVRGGAFKLISRSDLARMQEEIGFTTSSDLVNLSSQSRARIGKIKTVSKLLATSVGKIGETYSLTFKVFDASTAEIDDARSRTLYERKIDAILPLLRQTLAEVLAAPPAGIVLLPVEAPRAMPESVAKAFNLQLAAALAEAGVAVKPGVEGKVRIMPSVTAYSVRVVPDGDGFVYRGSVSGTISAEGAGVEPVVFSLNDVELGHVEGAAPPSLTAQYGAKLVSDALGGPVFKRRLSGLAELR